MMILSVVLVDLCMSCLSMCLSSRTCRDVDVVNSETGRRETPDDVVFIFFIVFDHYVFDAAAEVLGTLRRQRPLRSDFICERKEMAQLNSSLTDPKLHSFATNKCKY